MTTFNIKQLIGLPFSQAIELAEKNGFKLRQVRHNGQPLAITCDRRGDRINVETDFESIVLSVYIG